MNTHARSLFCTLVNLFATSYQRESFRALLALFLRGDGQPNPSRSESKSESALSRFLNHYNWSCRNVNHCVRDAAVSSILEYYGSRRGRRHRLLIMIDLTTLEKTGKFTALNLVSVLNGKRGVHIVVMYLLAGPLRIPWGYQVWRGKGEASAGCSYAAHLMEGTAPRSAFHQVPLRTGVPAGSNAAVVPARWQNAGRLVCTQATGRGRLQPCSPGSPHPPVMR